MLVTRYQLTLHDTLYYATREMGRLYETERVIHNWALTYALGLVHEALQRVGREGTTYFTPNPQVPRYREELPLVNELGIYVTPARPLSVDFALHTFKLANNRYHAVEKKEEVARLRKLFPNDPAYREVNKPSYGRAKELAPESIFEFFVLGKPPKPLPKWIRLGLWMSKAEIQSVDAREITPRNGTFICPILLNPLDLPKRPTIYDLIAMPPVSLVQNAQLEGWFIEIEDGIKLPADLQYLASLHTE